MKKLLKIWNRAAEWLCGFGSDKWVHFVVGALLAFFAAWIDVEVWHREVPNAAFVGFLVPFFLAPIKEVIDFMRGGKFDGKDMLFSWIGGVAGALLYALVMII